MNESTNLEIKIGLGYFILLHIPVKARVYFLNEISDSLFKGNTEDEIEQLRILLLKVSNLIIQTMDKAGYYVHTDDAFQRLDDFVTKKNLSTKKLPIKYNKNVDFPSELMVLARHLFLNTPSPILEHFRDLISVLLHEFKTTFFLQANQDLDLNIIEDIVNKVESSMTKSLDEIIANRDKITEAKKRLSLDTGAGTNAEPNVLIEKNAKLITKTIEQYAKNGSWKTLFKEEQELNHFIDVIANFFVFNKTSNITPIKPIRGNKTRFSQILKVTHQSAVDQPLSLNTQYFELILKLLPSTYSTLENCKMDITKTTT